MIEMKFFEDNMKKLKLNEYFKTELEKAGFTELELNKTPLVTRIILKVTKPGMAIGKGGKNIKMLTEEVKEKFNIENPQIEIEEIKNPDLNARATVDRIIALLEKGFSWRSVIYKTVDNIMAAGAQGVEIIIKGKLTGKGGRKSKQRIVKGYLKKVGSQTQFVDYAKGAAYPKAGAIGIKLRIIKPETIFPDKIDIKEYLQKRGIIGEKAEEKKKEKVEKETKESEEHKKEKTKKKEYVEHKKKEEKQDKKHMKKETDKPEKKKEEQQKETKEK